MKRTLTTSALLLAIAGTAAFAQGREGHSFGHLDGTRSLAIKNQDDVRIVETRQVYADGSTRKADMEDVTVTIYPTTPDED